MKECVTLHVRSLHSAVALPCRTGLRAVLQDSKSPVPLRVSVLSSSVTVSSMLDGRHGSFSPSEVVLREKMRGHFALLHAIATRTK